MELLGPGTGQAITLLKKKDRGFKTKTAFLFCVRLSSGCHSEKEIVFSVLPG